MSTGVAPMPRRDRWNPPDFLACVRSHVAAVVDEHPGETFAMTCRRARGAFPSLVADALGLEFTSARAPDRASGQRHPHPSPAHGEWYFSESGLDSVVSILGRLPLLLGAPSVAERLSGSSFLVDSSPWTTQRFRLGSASFVNLPVEQVELPDGFDSALIDPPWYGSTMRDWLARASSSVRRGGILALPLLGELTRPGADDDRLELLTFAREIGPIEIQSNAIEYSTPRFEECALAAAGVELHEPWRVADLVIIVNERPAQRRPLKQAPSDWTDFRVGDHLVSARPPTGRRRTGRAISEIVTLDSVSRRNPLMDEIDLWSSENRVATIADWPRALVALRALESQDEGVEPPSSVLPTVRQLARLLHEESV